LVRSYGEEILVVDGFGRQVHRLKSPDGKITAVSSRFGRFTFASTKDYESTTIWEWGGVNESPYPLLFVRGHVKSLAALNHDLALLIGSPTGFTLQLMDVEAEIVRFETSDVGESSISITQQGDCYFADRGFQIMRLESGTESPRGLGLGGFDFSTNAGGYLLCKDVESGRYMQLHDNSVVWMTTRAVNKWLYFPAHVDSQGRILISDSTWEIPTWSVIDGEDEWRLELGELSRFVVGVV